MLNINVKFEEPLKNLTTSSGSSPSIDMSIHVIKIPLISRETVPLSGFWLPSVLFVADLVTLCEDHSWPFLLHIIYLMYVVPWVLLCSYRLRCYQCHSSKYIKYLDISVCIFTVCVCYMLQYFVILDSWFLSAV
jgi:hypothetical protein